MGGLIAVIFIYRVVFSLRQGYSWKEMDWNQDGHTSIGEFFEAINIGKREKTIDNQKCVDFFSYKDGQSIKLVCPSPINSPHTP